jgi:competence protein ComEC
MASLRGPFWAMAASLTAAILIGHQTWAVIVLGYLVLRLFFLNDRLTLIVAVMVVLVVGLRCEQLLHERQVQTHSAGGFSGQLTVQPDAWRVNGDLASAVATKANGEQVQLFLTLTSQTQQHQVQSTIVPLSFWLRGKQEKILPATNTNEFDRQVYQANRGVYNQVTGESTILVGQGPRRLTDYLHQLRAKLSHRMTALPQPLAGYCRRLLIGEQDPEMANEMVAVKQLGVIHLFCLSGLHLVALCGLVRGFLTRLGVTKETIRLILVAVLPLYWVVGGGSISLGRATLMLELQLLAQMIGLRGIMPWAISLLIQTILSPTILLTTGGQLSYLLSFCLTWFKQPGGLSQTVRLSLVSLPPLLHSVYQFHVLSLVINYLMIPFFSLVIMPLSLGSGLIYPVFPELGQLVNTGLLLFHQGLDKLASLPGTITFGRVPAAVAVGMVVLTMLTWEKRGLVKWLLLIYFLTFTWIHFPLSGEVTFVDIGQGDCIIIREPFNRRVMMIDTGGKLNFQQTEANWKTRRASTTDKATSTSINYLKSEGIDHLDAIWLSHSDADHIGYLPTVLRAMKVDRIMVPAGMEKITKFTKRLPVDRVPTIIPITNRMVTDDGLQILHPFKSGQATNDDSVVLRGEFGHTSFLFTGDLPQAGELAVLQHYPHLQATVVKLGHHGSKTSSSPAFLRAVGARVGVISAGRNNRYGHPNQETLNTLKQLKMQTYSTQTQGMVTYRYNQRRGRFLWHNTSDQLQTTN